jgi:hypothetical protein
MGVWIGGIEGGTIGQITGEQMGWMSRALVQSACTCPFTQLQTQSAIATFSKKMNKINANKPLTEPFSSHLL